jgi:DnaJ-class molecular chaperone
MTVWATSRRVGRAWRTKGSSLIARPFWFSECFRFVPLPQAQVFAASADDGEVRVTGGVDGQPERRGAVQEELADLMSSMERRQHKRFAVDGFAEVLVADGTLLFRGRILDISVAGCYIETQARLRIAPGTEVEMVFRVNKMVFRPLATSRAVRLGEGAGFLFLNLNAKMQAELDALIAELSAEG